MRSRHFEKLSLLAVVIGLLVTGNGMAAGSHTKATGPAPKAQKSPEQVKREALMRQYKLEPKWFDIWYGKKDRLYLTGLWKLRKLPGTRDNPADDPGTKGGFSRPEYDDSAWELTIVPWDINLPYPPPKSRHHRPKRGFSGVFWYRKTFELPTRPPNTSALLFFGDVHEEATVYVNGREMGRHANRFFTYFRRGDNIQEFALDITDAARRGQRNTIAVRVFGLADRFRGRRDDRLGIKLPVWVELLPPVHLRRSLVTPRLAESKALAKVRIRNQLNFDGTREKMTALWHKRYLEQYRLSEICRGFNLHQSPYHYIGPDSGPVYEAFRSGWSPFWLGKANVNRNFYPDRPLEIDLLAVNDSRFDYEKASVTAKLIGPGGAAVAEVTQPIPDLRNGERERFRLALPLPADMKSGDHTLKLVSRSADGAEIHRNQYFLHLVRSDAIPRPPEPDAKVALYVGSPEKHTRGVRKMLQALNVRHAILTSFDDLDEFGILIIGVDAVDERTQKAGTKIHDWLVKGGKLLCLEQEGIGAVPWLRSVIIRRAGLYDTGPILVDIIAQDHPVFRGFRWHDFDIWNGNRGQIVDHFIQPLTPAVLGACMFQRGAHRVGMAAAEYKIGNGLCLLSQIEAVERFDRDPIASKYLARVLSYVLKDWSDQWARPAGAAALIKSVNPNRVIQVDLCKHANHKRRSPGKAPEPRRWVMKSASDLEDLPAGRVTFLGIPFDLPDAETPSCVAVGPEGSGLPARIQGIPVKKRVRRMFFLVAGAGVTDKMVRQRRQIGTIRIHYGPHGPVATEDIPLNLGDNVIPFDNPNVPLPKGAVAWTTYQVGHYRGPDKSVGVALFEWENPNKQIEVESVSLIAGKAGAAMVLGVAAEK